MNNYKSFNFNEIISDDENAVCSYSYSGNSESGTDYTLLIVSAGSPNPDCVRGKIGAEFAVEVCKNLVEDLITKDKDLRNNEEKLKNFIKVLWDKKVIAHYNSDNGNAGSAQILDLYDCTLVMMISYKNYNMCLSLGDNSCAVCFPDKSSISIPQNDNLKSSLAEAAPVFEAVFLEKQPAAVYLSSAGIKNSFKALPAPLDPYKFFYNKCCEKLFYRGVLCVDEIQAKLNRVTKVTKENIAFACMFNSGLLSEYAKPDEPTVCESSEIKKLLECDKIRCRLDTYEESILYAINRGHWDLFNKPEVKDSKGVTLLARDPRKDIKNGVVGIDFGTKSTVVVRQDDTNRIVPIRIGTGNLGAAVKESDFENPTFIECSDIVSFLEKYYSREGRPETSCNDLFISYDAFNSFKSCPPESYYAYFSELKQWVNNEKKNSKIKDKKEKVFSLSYNNSKENSEINPIELYAYYIGMYINNMRNGIYMKYLLSFPVGYSRTTRENIRKSFESGIKKSLPESIVSDNKVMEKFNVSLGISEPAAYAVSALEMSKLDPADENEKYMYGIFDFGGGTTDFDFGLWRGASEEENDMEGYDYVLECFGADSDVTLGGENILELLAYTVFKENIDTARDKELSCSLPVGEAPPIGDVLLITDSQVAMRNMSIIKEELRPLWHQEEGWIEKYKANNDEQDNNEEFIETTLYSRNGKSVPNCRLILNSEELIDIIKKRIEKGVAAFFRCMVKTFKDYAEILKNVDKIYIFLAGNSSKSRFVKELFDAEIRKYYDKFKCIDSSARENYFVLIEPLQDLSVDSRYIPNGKTSVAYGLVKSREGSTIKIVKNYETDSDSEARFKYYLGSERKGKFDCRLSPKKTEYNEWIKFQGASSRKIIRLYYTTDSSADVASLIMNIEEAHYKEIAITPEEGKYLFIRTCSPTEIEYAVAESSENIKTGRVNITKLDFYK